MSQIEPDVSSSASGEQSNIEEEKKTIEQVAKETASLFKRFLKKEGGESKHPYIKTHHHKKIELKE